MVGSQLGAAAAAGRAAAKAGKQAADNPYRVLRDPVKYFVWVRAFIIAGGGGDSVTDLVRGVAQDRRR